MYFSATQTNTAVSVEGKKNVGEESTVQKGDRQRPTLSVESKEYKTQREEKSSIWLLHYLWHMTHL